MRFTGVSPESGGTGLTVHTSVTNPSTRPGLRLPGRVTLTAGATDVPVGHIRLGLVSTVEPEDPDQPRRLVQFHQATVSGGFVLPAGRRRSVAFALPLPWELPVTVFGGAPLLALRMGLRTEVALDGLLDQGPMVPVFVHPLPSQQHVLAALDTLGFTLRQVGLQAGRLPGVAQTLPFHQRINYWVGPLYAGPITELELVFLADPAALEVIIWLDRRLSLAGVTHQSISRFKVWHVDADRRDFVSLVDGWLRQAINRHAAAAAHAEWSGRITGSAHVSRPPAGPVPPAAAPDAPNPTTGATGDADGAGSGDGT